MPAAPLGSTGSKQAGRLHHVMREQIVL